MAIVEITTIRAHAELEYVPVQYRAELRGDRLLIVEAPEGYLSAGLLLDEAAYKALVIDVAYPGTTPKAATSPDTIDEVRAALPWLAVEEWGWG